MKTEINKKQLPKILRKYKVVSAFLFGSQAKEKTGSLSDIDIAVFLDERVPREKYFDVKLHLLGELMDLLKRNDIDLVILNEAPPLLSYRVLKEGVLIFCQDKKKLLENEVRTVLRYLDWKPFLEKYTEEVFGSI